MIVIPGDRFWLFCRTLALVLLLSPNVSVHSQSYGNEWIHYDQKYFRIALPYDGLYRLSFQGLQSTVQPFGILLENIPPENFQVWSRGQQLYLNVCLGQDGVFNQGDYIEFLAEKNDGWFDSTVYQHPQDQINPYYSLFNDTAYCYFSWNSTGGNPRIGTENNTYFNAYPPLSYVLSTKMYVFSETYLAGRRYNTASPDVTIGDAAYTGGEGYSGNKIWVNLAQTRNISLERLYPPGPPAKLDFTLVGGSNRELTINQQHIQVGLGTVNLLDSNWAFNIPVKFNRIIPNTQFPAGNGTLMIKNIFVPGQIMQEWASVSSINVVYARNLNFSDQNSGKFSIPQTTTTGYSYLKMSGITLSAGDSIRLYDLTDHLLIKTVFEDGYVKALVPDNAGDETCYFIKESNIYPVQKIEAVDPLTASFVPYTSPQMMQGVDYLIITHKSLRIGADNYAEYRHVYGYPQTFNTLVVDIDQLYDQFACGIPKHPLAIRNFLRYINDHYNQQLRHVFLIGKSFQAIQYRGDPYYYKNTLVPTWGYPPSDLIFTLGLSQPDEIDIPVGRLSAHENANVEDYLDKVRDFESNQQIPGPGLKNVIQFGGGSGFLEQALFKDYLLNYDTLLRSPFFGARMFNFFKQTPDPVEVNQTAFLHDLLENKGVSLVNYFAHAGGISFDMSLGDPGNFNNHGKYYFVTANSCWAGDIFNYHGGLSSEQYVLLPGKGAIGYLASVTEGETPYLHAYTKRLFNHLSGDLYGKPLGSIIRQTVHDILHDTLMNTFSYKETCYEMTLHGDPALVLNSPAFPDYDITPSPVTPSTISFIPEEVSNELDSFRIRIIQANWGKAMDTSYFIRIQRQVAGNFLTDTLIRVHAPYNEDTLYVTLAVDRDKGLGINTITITLDALNEIDENGREFNNSWQVDVFIKSYDVVPVFPPEFAIVPESEVSLYASTSYPFAYSATYILQLDTTDTFDSPLKLEKATSQPGGVIAWNLQLPLIQDSLVYFWRIGVLPSSPDSVQWRNSSFQYIPGTTGWSQAHFLQMGENGYQYVHYLKDSLKFVYVQDVNTLVAQTYITNNPWQEENYKINNNVMDMWSCAQTACSGSTGLKLAVFNPVSFEPWYSYDTLNGIGPWGDKHCKGYPTPSFDFCNGDSASRSLITRLINAVPLCYYVLAMSHLSPKTQEFEEPLYQAFESLGSNTVRQVADTSSYIIFGRKGWTPGQAYETGLNSARDSLLNLTVNVETSWNNGSITSPQIGPALAWHSIHWRVVRDIRDSVGLTVIGIKNSGSADTLFRNIPADSTNLTQLEQQIPAKVYPYLQLILSMKDTSNNPAYPRTPAILKRWQVIYDGLPETAIDPALGYHFYKDTLQEGDSVKLNLTFHNISDQNMDSLLVVYYVKQGNMTDTLIKKRLRPHPAHDLLNDSITFSTRGKTGLYHLWTEINPYHDQPELTHVNNIGMMNFFVWRDLTNPLMDVTFDDRHILDYDYVSSKTRINIRLRDENLYLPLADTSVIKVWLAFEDENEVPVYYHTGGPGQLSFTPGLLPDNICKVLYLPKLDKDGVYTLRVKACDASGNQSGKEDYIIHFTVLHSALRSDVLAFPNPFREYTRFGFILTGNCIPEEITITISDITGKVVKIISTEEFGELHIGTNMSASLWDGRDDQGNRLPNGVYTYKVQMKFPCEEPGISRSLTGKTIYFTSISHGKVILMR